MTGEQKVQKRKGEKGNEEQKSKNDAFCTCSGRSGGEWNLLCGEAWENEKRNRCGTITRRTLKGNFRTRADSITGNRTKRNGGRKKFNVKFIVKTGDFLYN